MARRLSNEQKVTVLRLILEKKEILFGAFSPILTKEIKNSSWEDIANKTKALGLFSSSTTGESLRTVTWQNWRKRTIEKRDNRRKTGTGGGENWAMNIVDDIIIEIIGKESPVLCGLDLQESSGTSAALQEFELPLQLNDSQFFEPVQTCVSTGNKSVDKLNKRQTLFQVNVAEKKRIAASEDEIREKKKKLLDLEIYKRRLEVFELETRLGLPMSTYTKDIQMPGNNPSEEIDVENSTMNDSI